MNKNVWILVVCQGLMLTNNTLLFTAAALVGVMLAENNSLATLPLALQYLSTMLISIPASLMMGRFGRRAGFMLASIIGLCGALIATYAIFLGDFWLFCFGTILIGSFNGFGNFYRFAVVEVVRESQKSRAISYVIAGGVVAAVLGPNLANWTYDSISATEFVGSYIVVCILYVLSFILLSFIHIPLKHAEIVGEKSARPMMKIIRQPLFFVAVLSGMFSYAVMSLIMTATPLSMHHHHSFSDTAFIIQWHVLGMFAPSFFTGKLISRYGLVNVMFIGAFLLMIAVMINLLGNTLWHYWLALFSLGVGWNFLFIGATDLLTYSYKENEKSRAQAFNDFMVFGAVTISALMASYLQYNFGWEMVNLGVLPLIIIIMMALVWLRYIEKDIEHNA